MPLRILSKDPQSTFIRGDRSSQNDFAPLGVVNKCRRLTTVISTEREWRVLIGTVRNFVFPTLVRHGQMCSFRVGASNECTNFVAMNKTQLNGAPARLWLWSVKSIGVGTGCALERNDLHHPMLVSWLDIEEWIIKEIVRQHLSFIHIANVDPDR